MTAPEDWVWLARIRRPQGRKGEVFADVLTDFPEKFSERKRLWLLNASAAEKSSQIGLKSQGATSIVPQTHQASGHDFSRAANSTKNTRPLAPGGQFPREVELADHWLHKGGVVLHFAGVDSISAAETLNGLIVAIPLAQRAALGEDEFYTGDLIGCTLVDVAQTEPVIVGEIEEVDRNSGPVALLVVRGAAGEVLVPFAKSYLRNVDLAAKRVEMALPEGLVELNAPGKAL
ncbi:MAG: ribosome maturation factor RimM [Terracidiphilus sp.]|jgi:16S rRNA processing protein RimM